MRLAGLLLATCAHAGLYDVAYPPGDAAIEIVWGDPICVSTNETLVYNGWPWGMASYDATRDQILLGYTTGSVHNENGDPVEQFDKVPRAVVKANASSEDMAGTTNTFGSAVAVYPATAGTSAMSQAMKSLSDGTYVAIVGFAVHPGWFDDNATAVLCVSTNGGTTWTTNDLESAAGGIGSSYPCGLFETASGRLLHNNTFEVAADLVEHKPRTIYTDTQGNPWTIGQEVQRGLWLLDEPADRWLWEPEYFQLRTGRIVAYWRTTQNIGNSVSPLYWNYSDDDGETWSPVRPTNRSTNANPIGLAGLPDGRTIAIIGSRETGAAGLYACIQTEEMLGRGKLGEKKLLVTGLATNTWGYPAVVTVGSRIWVYYYTGTDARADVWELRGSIQ